MLRRNARRLADLEREVAVLRDAVGPKETRRLVPEKPVTTKTRWVALGAVLFFTVVFSVAMYVAIYFGAGHQDKNVIALVGAIAVGVSVAATNVATLIDEWESPRRLSFDGVMVMIAFGTGAVGSGLVIFGLF